VRVLLREELVARLGEDPERDLVRHRRRRQVDRRLLPQQLGAAPLELVHGRILALLLVADDRGGDRGAHRLRRTRGGIGAEIDHECHSRKADPLTPAMGSWSIYLHKECKSSTPGWSSTRRGGTHAPCFKAAGAALR